MTRYSAIVGAMAIVALAHLAVADCAAKRGAFAVGYDEGIAAKYFVMDNAAVFLGVDYLVTSPDTVDRQPLNNASAKVGFEYLIKSFGPLRFNAVADVQGGLVQEEILPLVGTSSFTRTNVWGGRFRIGIAPEFFFADHFSLTYRCGAALYYYGTHYQLNATGTSTESKKSDHVDAGVFGDPLNIGFNVYF